MKFTSRLAAIAAMILGVGILSLPYFTSGCATTPVTSTVSTNLITGVVSTNTTGGLLQIGNLTVSTNDVYLGIKAAAKLGVQAGVNAADTNVITYLNLSVQTLTLSISNGQYDSATLTAALNQINPNVSVYLEAGLSAYQIFAGQLVTSNIANANIYLLPALTALRDGIADGLQQVTQPTFIITNIPPAVTATN